MKINYNRKLIKRLLEVSIPLCIITTSLSGCTNTTSSEIIVQDASKEDCFTSFENIQKQSWCVMKYTDGTYDMLKLISYDNHDNLIQVYYYSNVFTEYHVDEVISYYYNHDAYWIDQGKDVDSYISVADYIIENDKDGSLLHDYYTENGMEIIFKAIQNDYDKKIDDKQKVIIRDNLLY